MIIDRDLWLTYSFTDRKTPPWPCPWCKHGTLLIKTRGGPAMTKRALRARQRQAKWRTIFRRTNKPDATQRPDLMFLESLRLQTAKVAPGFEKGVFTAILDCNNPECWEVVAVAGDTSQDLEWIQGDDVYFPRYFPRVFHPPLVIFEIPEKSPRDIRDEITVAFELYWSNPSACLNRIRVTAEFLLTHLGISTHAANGKFLMMGARIKMLRDTHPALADILDQIRVLGNQASHEASVQRSHALDGFQLIGQALESLP
jgi:hypothetical protein